MILTKSRYETNNQELFAIVEALKTRRYYLEDCKYEIYVFINHNNLRQFMNTKNLSSYQVSWA